MGVVIECIRIIEDSDKRGSDKRGCTVLCFASPLSVKEKS